MGKSQELSDPEDGLPVSKAGDWAQLKHKLLADYVHSTWAVRRKLRKTRAMPTYTDLFAGPGRAMIKPGEIIDGSPLVAWKAAAAHEAPFTSLFASDINKDFVDAVDSRLKALKAPVVSRFASALEAAPWAAAQMDANSYHLVFADPFNLASLPWDVFKPFLRHEHLDFIVHFSEGDLTRNLDTYTVQEQSSLDRFAPGWRERVGGMGEPAQMRGRFFEHWISLFEAERYKLAATVPLITNSKNVKLYRLVLLSRHPLGEKIWKSVAKQPQGVLDL
jgi:three-Cys-motif partner protein